MTVPPTPKTSYPIQRSARPRRRRWVALVLTLVICFFILASAVTVYVWKVLGSQFMPFWPSDESVGSAREFNMVVAGLDQVDHVNRTDSIVILHINIPAGTVGAIFLPRDTRVEIPGYGVEKVNSAFARGGPPLMIRTLENFLDVEIPFYAIVRIPAFVKLIDAAGGVDIEVEKNMRYTDRAQGLYINLQKGRQHLDGEKAMHYARFRHDWNGDLGRIERQQKLIRALSKKFFSFEIVKNIPSLLISLQREQLVITNLALSDARFLARFFNNDETKRNLRMYSMPGIPDTIRGISYVIPDYEEIPYLRAAVLKGGYHPDNRLVKIEVANGCGSSGIADSFARRLTYYGFDVLETSNAENFDYDRTTIIVYRKTPFDSRLANLLDADIVREPNPEVIPHLRIVIGKDKLPGAASGGM